MSITAVFEIKQIIPGNGWKTVYREKGEGGAYTLRTKPVVCFALATCTYSYFEEGRKTDEVFPMDCEIFTQMPNLVYREDNDDYVGLLGPGESMEEFADNIKWLLGESEDE